MRNKIVSVANTTCKARLSRNVPMNITAVNNPHMARYAAIAVSLEAAAHPNFATTISVTSESQNRP